MLANRAELWSLVASAELNNRHGALYWIVANVAVVVVHIAAAVVAVIVVNIAAVVVSNHLRVRASIIIVLYCGLSETSCSTYEHHTDHHHACKCSLHNLKVF